MYYKARGESVCRFEYFNTLLTLLLYAKKEEHLHVSCEHKHELPSILYIWCYLCLRFKMLRLVSSSFLLIFSILFFRCSFILQAHKYTNSFYNHHFHFPIGNGWGVSMYAWSFVVFFFISFHFGCSLSKFFNSVEYLSRKIVENVCRMHY